MVQHGFQRVYHVNELNPGCTTLQNCNKPGTHENTESPLEINRPGVIKTAKPSVCIRSSASPTVIILHVARGNIRLSERRASWWSNNILAKEAFLAPWRCTELCKPVLRQQQCASLRSDCHQECYTFTSCKHHQRIDFGWLWCF